MAQLDGTGRPVDIAPGFRIAAPGLAGTATARERRPPNSPDRGPEVVMPAFDQVAEQTGLREILNIELDVRVVPRPDPLGETRGMEGADEIVLETPDLGEDVGQVVLALDEGGGVTWNFPVSQAHEIETPATRGTGGSKRFMIRRTSFPPEPSGAADRGLFGALGRKFLKVLVYPVTDAVLGPVSEYYAGKWEAQRRPYLLRSFGPGDFRGATGQPVTDWASLASGPALLFVHGTFATSHTGFGHLPDATMLELYRRYEGRIFAFDHFTLSHTAEENVAEFAARMPDGIRLNVDVVSHSRGGLVTRVLAGELGAPAPGLDVRRAVLVATPNEGTALADADHMTDFIDRYTTILNLVPPGPLEIVSDILEAIVTTVKVIGHAALRGLPGLLAMDPRGSFISRLNREGVATADYYAIAADYTPAGSLRHIARMAAADFVADRVFDRAANDLVVPTLGVARGGSQPGFPISGTRAYAFEGTAQVQHTNFFGAPDTSARLLEWLPGR